MTRAGVWTMAVLFYIGTAALLLLPLMGWRSWSDVGGGLFCLVGLGVVPWTILAIGWDRDF